MLEKTQLKNKELLQKFEYLKIGILNGNTKPYHTTMEETPFIYYKGGRSIKDILSFDELERIQSKYGKVETASVVKDGDNRFYYNMDTSTRDIQESITADVAITILNIQELLDKTFNTTNEVSSCFFYPKGGYCGWHTNSNNYLIDITWVEEGNKSFYRYKDIDTNEIITVWDKQGWQINKFKVPKDEPFWHCVGSNTNRISFGFKWELKNK